MSYELSGKVALVTGVLNKYSIGHAISLRLAQDGADVAVVDINRMPQPLSEEDRIEGWRGLDSVVEEIEAMGRQGIAIVADVTRSEQVKEMVDKTLAKLGKIDILVNNAAILGPLGVPTLEYDDQIWHKVLAVNLTGPFLCSKVVAKVMVERGQGGKIVNVASLAGKIGCPGIAAYGASKAGLINLTQTLALELAPYKINVNALCPGTTFTEMGTGHPIRRLARELGISIEEATDQVYAEQIRDIPLGRVALPEEQANAVAFLASKESDFITGIALNVTGGRVMVP